MLRFLPEVKVILAAGDQHRAIPNYVALISRKPNSK